MTRGRYYFAPPGTPTYPGEHLFGSRTWDDQNFLCDYPLGELRTGPDQWDGGGLPEVVPDNRIVGTADCIARGELLADGVPIASTIAGFPAACFISPTMPTQLERKLFAIFRCDVRVFYARLIGAMYDDDDLAIAQQIARFTDGQIVATVHASTPALPSIVTMVTPDYSVCVIDGSRTPQQFAAQALYGLVGPQNFGVFGTSAFWYGASQYALLKLTNDGGDPTKPMLFVGHSYGAVVAALCAVRALTQEPFGKRSLLTFGMPKPGDERLTLLLQGLRASHISNDDDAVTILPPRVNELYPLLPLFTPAILTLWPRWETADAHFVFDPDGNVTRGQANELDYYVLSTIITRALAPIAMLPIVAHTIAEYARRIDLQCPKQVIPANGALVLSGRVSPADGRMLMKAPAIATGGLQFRGERDKPGKTCGDALEIVLGNTYSGTWPDKNDSWFTFRPEYGVTYTITVHRSLAGTFGWGAWFVGEDCPSKALLTDFGADGSTYTFTGDEFGGTIFIVIFLTETVAMDWSFDVQPPKEAQVMTGQISMYGAATPPAGWLACDGAAISRTTFADLFAAIGTVWGVGDGSTTFNLPDLRGRAPIGQGTGSGLTARSIAGSGGEETHVLSEAELASHNHTNTAKSRAAFALTGASRVDVWNVTGADLSPTYDTDNAGSNTAHNNMQPYKVVAFIIKT